MVMNISCQFEKSSYIYIFFRAVTVKSIHLILSGGYNEDILPKYEVDQTTTEHIKKYTSPVSCDSSMDRCDIIQYAC